MRALSLSFVVYLGCTVGATAQTVADYFSDVNPSDFVRAFLGTCVLNEAQYERIEGYLELLQSPDLPDEMLPFVAPLNEPIQMRAFIVNGGEGNPYLLAVSRAQDEGVIYDTCVVTNPYIDPEEVLSSLEEFANLSEPSEISSFGGQQYRIYRQDTLKSGAFISTVDASPMQQAGITLSFSVPSE